jgi:hypothetical protein
MRLDVDPVAAIPPVLKAELLAARRGGPLELEAQVERLIGRDSAPPPALVGVQPCGDIGAHAEARLAGCGGLRRLGAAPRQQ